MCHFAITHLCQFSYNITLSPRFHWCFFKLVDSQVNPLLLLTGETFWDYLHLRSETQVCPTLQPHGLKHARPPCPSPTPKAYWNSCPWSQWCHPTVSSFVIPLSSCLQSFPALGYFSKSQFFPSGGQHIGASVSASVLPVNIQDWFPLG